MLGCSVVWCSVEWVLHGVRSPCLGLVGVLLYWQSDKVVVVGSRSSSNNSQDSLARPDSKHGAEKPHKSRAAVVVETARNDCCVSGGERRGSVQLRSLPSAHKQ